MPRINITGQEKPYGPKHDWKTIQNMIYENLFCSIPEEVEQFLEEKKEDVRKDDKRKSN